jgi:hypothetical protein
MSDRADWIAIIIVAAAFVTITLYAALPTFPFILAEILAVVFTVAIYGYGTFWAFRIRRALAVRIYRNQALGIGLVALGWILILFDNLLVTAYIPFFIINISVDIVLFYFVDASVLAGRRYDPLLRDTLRWSKLRIVLWILNFAVAAIVISLVTYYQITTGNEPQFMQVYGGYLLVYVIQPVSLIALAITALRSRDKLLRVQVAWFGAFLAAVLLIVDVSRVANSDAGVFIGLWLGGYCLFRSARSLVPLNKLEVIVAK